ncbi:hypothetical protein [Micromonospora sp. NPDC048947]|uniref:hypothetical protein n=1 Tax=Micromonospora sp. NPDC048947 TaxID=3154826 RepID=UPI00340F0C13
MSVTAGDVILANREYEQVAHTGDLFVTEQPWKVSVDLPEEPPARPRGGVIG